jgi:hypothetical protein
VIACHLNMCILKFELGDDSRILEGVTARIHGLKAGIAPAQHIKLSTD